MKSRRVWRGIYKNWELLLKSKKASFKFIIWWFNQARGPGFGGPKGLGAIVLDITARPGLLEWHRPMSSASCGYQHRIKFQPWLNYPQRYTARFSHLPTMAQLAARVPPKVLHGWSNHAVPPKVLHGYSNLKYNHRIPYIFCKRAT